MASVLQTSAASKSGETPAGARPASGPAPAARSRRAHLSPRASAHLDWIRGLAAAAVMLSHVRGLFFVDYPALPRRSPALAALYGLTALGHQAVMVFFVLSGFFISTSVVSALRERRWSWAAYLINRVSRLELVLFPALLLGALWDQIGLRLSSGFALYHSGLYKFYEPSVALRSTVSGFFGNLFFLQSIRFQVFGSNGPLWSLSYEFWYYLLFPALVLAIFSRGSALGRVASFLLAVAVAAFIGPQICFYFLIWLAGAAVALSPRVAALRKPSLFWPGALFTCGLFAATLALSLLHRGLVGKGLDLVIGAAFALWLFVLTHVSSAQVSHAYSATARTLAGGRLATRCAALVLRFSTRGLDAGVCVSGRFIHGGKNGSRAKAAHAMVWYLPARGRTLSGGNVMSIWPSSDTAAPARRAHAPERRFHGLPLGEGV
jgi:peptidoglycan/LPS O-acetylase OafA/YrhL